MTENSTIIPINAGKINEAKMAKKKFPVKPATKEALKAPTMKKEPWARFINPITPNIKVKPADIKKSINPNCMPFNNCSIKSCKDIFHINQAVVELNTLSFTFYTGLHRNLNDLLDQKKSIY